MTNADHGDYNKYQLARRERILLLADALPTGDECLVRADAASDVALSHAAWEYDAKLAPYVLYARWDEYCVRCYAQGLPLLLRAIRPLGRRLAAGTLAPDALRPYETAFYTAYTTKSMAAVHRVRGHTPSTKGHLFGRVALFNAGRTTASILVACLELQRAAPRSGAPSPRSVELTDARDELAAVLAAVIRVSAQPRPLSWNCGEEWRFVDAVRERIPALEQYGAASWGAPLLAAYQELEAGGVWRKDGVAYLFGEGAWSAHYDSFAKARERRLEERGLVCAACSAREPRFGEFKLCAACKTVAYCSKEHQQAHWREHKAACKAARKAHDTGGPSSSQPTAQ